jgi:hypothetical protein
MCRYPEAGAYVRQRILEGASIKVIASELTRRGKDGSFGYRTAVSPPTVKAHIDRHSAIAPMPTYMDPPSPRVDEPTVRDTRDVASVIAQRSLEMLDAGEMRLTASHALQAQAILDRRQEKQRDRELLLVLARVLTRDSAPPLKYVGTADAPLIEGGAVEVA